MTTVKSNERRMDELIDENRQLKQKEDLVNGRISDAVNNETANYKSRLQI